MGQECSKRLERYPGWNHLNNLLQFEPKWRQSVRIFEGYHIKEGFWDPPIDSIREGPLAGGGAVFPNTNPPTHFL